MTALPTRVVIQARFNGPPGSANGGYACGVLAARFGRSAEVTLRKPPPLERELAIAIEGSGEHGHWELQDGETLIASGRVAEPDIVCPDPPPVALARAAEANYADTAEHPYPTCFVCGPARSPGDGLRLFTGKVEGRNLVASAWTPLPNMGGAEGAVDPVIVWSALDCPSYFGGRLNGYASRSVLGRLTAKLVADVKVGAPHIVIGWPLGRDGRKWEGGSAIFNAEGELCAFARGLWVELKS